MPSTQTQTKTWADPSGHIPFRKRLGQCYVLAGTFASHHPDVILVHGSIQGFEHPRIDHAWVQLPNGDIWEPGQGQIWPEPVFTAFFNSTVHATYTHLQTISQTLTHRHWGPWHDQSPT